MRPVTLNLTAVQDPAVLAALQQIQSASQDTLQNDGSSSGTAIATMTGATLASGGDEVAYFTGQYTTAYTAFSAFGQSWVGAASASAALTLLGGVVTSVATGAGLTGGPITSTGTILLDPSYLRNYIAGLTLSNDGTTPNSVLDIAAGVCVDSTNATLIKLGAFTKTTGSTWAAGSGSHGMGAGLTVANNTWYHVFAIINSGTADVYFDTSVTAANAPSGTTAFRRIGSFKTASGSTNILTFSQFADEFLWGTPIVEINIASLPTSATLLTLVGVPPGVKTSMRYRAELNASAGCRVLIQSPDETSAVADALTGNEDLFANAASNGVVNAIVRTSTIPQIRWSANNSNGTQINLNNFGWIDDRGKNA